MGGIVYLPRTEVKRYLRGKMTQDAAHIKGDKSPINGCGPQGANLNNGLKNSRELKELLSFNHKIFNRTRVPSSCDIDQVSPSIKLNNNIENKSLHTLRESLNSISQQNNNVVVNNYQDSLKDCQISIRHKRLCSSSSAVSNTSIEEQPPLQKKRRKQSSFIKDDKILTTSEQYITQASEIGSLGMSSDAQRDEISCVTTLEVPRWRIRMYTCLYSMEGTENLDDDVFNKRHMRLEIDERRRKKWDVQRIREQRVIEKLRLRQERVSSGYANDNSKSVSSLWPTLEDIKHIEVCDELPVSAFGALVPRLPPSEFSLPWLTNLVEPKLIDLMEPKLPSLIESKPEILENQKQPLVPLKPLPVTWKKPSRKPKKRRKNRRRYCY